MSTHNHRLLIGLKKMQRLGHRLRRPVAAVALALLLAGATAPVDSQAAKAMSMREKVYEKLSRAQEAVEIQDWEEAFDKLEDVEKMKDLSDGEKAQLYTAFGYAYFAQEKYDESASAYAQVLAIPELPPATRLSTLYTLGQLHFHLEHYDVAVGHLESWLKEAENPGPEPYILLGQAYYQLEQLDKAEEPIKQAIAVAKQRDLKVQENWYALLRVIYFETQEYEKLLDVLEVLVTDYPAKEYWLHLSSAYGEMGNSARQLASYEMAYEQGYLTRGSEIVLLAQLLLQAEVPYRAGVLMRDGLESGIIEGNAANWRLLSQAWILSSENEAALVALGKAAELSDDGELHARIAQTYINLGEWEKSVSAAQVAIDRGVDDPEELQLMQGMAYFEMGRFSEAKQAFAAAQRSDKNRTTATRWLAYVQREEKRLQELGLN